MNNQLWTLFVVGLVVYVLFAIALFVYCYVHWFKASPARAVDSAVVAGVWPFGLPLLIGWQLSDRAIATTRAPSEFNVSR